MHSIKVTTTKGRKTKTKTLLFPESYEEVKEKQFRQILPFILNEDLNEDYRKQWITFFLSGLSMDAFNTLKLKLENVLDIYEECLLWTQEVDHTQVVKSFKHKGVEYCTMPSNFDVPILEIVFMDQYYELFKAGDSEQLDTLLAVMSRPRTQKDTTAENFDGDFRARFNEVGLEERAKAFKDLDFTIKMACVLQYLGGKKYIAEEYDLVFQQNRSNEKKGADAMPQFLRLIYDLAENGTFGDWEKTAYTKIHVILYKLLNEKLAAIDKKKGRR